MKFVVVMGVLAVAAMLLLYIFSALALARRLRYSVTDLFYLLLLSGAQLAALQALAHGTGYVLAACVGALAMAAVGWIAGVANANSMDAHEGWRRFGRMLQGYLVSLLPFHIALAAALVYPYLFDAMEGANLYLFGVLQLATFSVLPLVLVWSYAISLSAIENGAVGRKKEPPPVVDDYVEQEPM